ncbi:alpha/beta hydrolase fold protein [Nostoc sp. NIES-4103]|nr:alpha/beta hydrolase fold protein [Nostoc sp. NIES-4103]
MTNYKGQPLRVIMSFILVITAEKDPILTARMGNNLARCFVNGTHLHFANAGHLIMAECAELVNQAIAI